MKLVPLKSLRLHPEANRVPRMPPEQDAEFQADIAARGIRVPIEIIDGGVIVDGRSRYLAVKQLGVEQLPVIRAPLNGDDPVLYMLRAATKRRHLTDDQRACLAREEMEILGRIATGSCLNQQRLQRVVQELGLVAACSAMVFFGGSGIAAVQRHFRPNVFLIPGRVKNNSANQARMSVATDPATSVRRISRPA